MNIPNISRFIHFDCLIWSAARYKIKLAHVWSKIILFDWIEPVYSLFLAREDAEQVKTFEYLGSCISTSKNNIRDIRAKILQAQTAFSNLHHLWHCMDISSATQDRVYNVTVRSTLLYGCQTWPLRSEDFHELQVLDHRYLCFIRDFSWKQRIINKEIRLRIIGDHKLSKRVDKSFFEVAFDVQDMRLRWIVPGFLGTFY